tara:strand:- start:207 stop:401 length:195 start_codon:yes stop_codon:yes gene_type:complete
VDADVQVGDALADVDDVADVAMHQSLIIRGIEGRSKVKGGVGERVGEDAGWGVEAEDLVMGPSR